MSDVNDASDDVKRLRAISRTLCDSLRFAAPEIWMLHIGDALAGAYHLGKHAARSASAIAEVHVVSEPGALVTETEITVTPAIASLGVGLMLSGRGKPDQ